MRLQQLTNYQTSASLNLETRRKEAEKDLAKAKALNVNTTAVFSAVSAPDALSSPEILGDITVRNAGELSEVLPGANGLIIAYVAERKPAGADELATVQNQVATSVIRRRSRLIFGDWQKSLISNGKKKDNQVVEPVSDSSPGDDDQN